MSGGTKNNVLVTKPSERFQDTRVILKKFSEIWGEERQNIYVRRPHQSDEGGWGVKRILLFDIYNPKTQNSFLLDSTTANNQGSPMVSRGSDTNLSRPICDTILKRLEGPTKDRTAYWHAFARWISLHQHYIIDGDTYKRHTMPHEYNIILHKITIRLRMKHKQKLKRHPPC